MVDPQRVKALEERMPKTEVTLSNKELRTSFTEGEKEVAEKPKRRGRPRKRFRAEKHNFNFHIPLDLFDKICEFADDSGMSITAWMVLALRSRVRNWDPGLRPETKGGRKIKKGETQREKEEWGSGWPKDEPCPYSNCDQGNNVGHDPAMHFDMMPEEFEIALRVCLADRGQER